MRLADGVRVLCVEMDCEGPSGLADIALKGEADSKYVWQKERLVNYGCSILAGEGIEYLGYVDADCFFAHSRWPRQVVEKFESGFNIVQGFSRALAGKDSVPAALTSFPKLGTRFHGGAMFLHRDLFLRIGGFYEYCIVGGCDSVLLMAVTGDLGSLGRIFPNESFRNHVTRWMDLIRAVEIRPTCADNTIEILEHGNRYRSHRMRHALLEDFVPDEDIMRGDILSLTERGRRLIPRLRAYTAHREDRADIIARRDVDP